MRHGDPLKGKAAPGAASRYIDDVVMGFKGEGCLIWPFTRGGNGYPSVTYKGRFGGAHRIICELAHGAPPTPKHEAAHLCGHGHLGCVNPSHLQWKTSKENKADMLVHGTRRRGTRQHSAILKDEDVKQIRALRGIVQGRDLARRYGVSPATITSVQKRNSWAWL